MKIRFLTLFICGLCLHAMQAAYAQKPFPEGTDNAQWGVEVHTIGVFDLAQHIYYQGDTLINGRTYNRYEGVQYYTNAPGLAPPTNFSFMMRQQGQKVYWKHGNADRLLYDFSLQEGDSVWLPDSPFFGIDSTRAGIDSIRTVTNTGTNRSMFYLRYRANDFQGMQVYYRVQWLEGVGSTEGPLYALTRSRSPIADDDFHYTVCLRENNILKYLAPSYTSCASFLTAEEKQPIGAAFRLTHNPAQGEAVLSYSVRTAGMVTVAVYDLLGRKQCQVQHGAQPAGDYQQPLPSFRPGLYLVAVEANGQRQLLRYVQE